MPILILTPTPMEMARVRPAVDAAIGARPHAFQVCGFGQIAAAARTAALVTRYQPSRVLLIGIAGTFRPDVVAVGDSCRFDEVICSGIGVGVGENFRGAAELGWDQFGCDGQWPHIGDVIPLVSTFMPGVPCAGALLSVTSASATADDADRRAARYPHAVAEDMEGFGVATACGLAGVPLQIVRGISNVVGDRDKANWQIDAALDAAVKMAMQLIKRDWIPTQA